MPDGERMPPPEGSPNPRLGRLPEHHTCNAGDRQHNGQHVGLAEAIGQQAETCSHAPNAADDAGSAAQG